MQAYLNQEFPIGLTDLRLHPAVVAEDPGEGQDDGVEMRARAACPASKRRPPKERKRATRANRRQRCGGVPLPLSPALPVAKSLSHQQPVVGCYGGLADRRRQRFHAIIWAEDQP